MISIKIMHPAAYLNGEVIAVEALCSYFFLQLHGAVKTFVTVDGFFAFKVFKCSAPYILIHGLFKYLNEKEEEVSLVFIEKVRCYDTRN